MIFRCKRAVASIGAVLAAFACACTGPMQAGSETTSGVKITVTGSTIRVTATPEASVMLFDARFNPGDAQKTADTAAADDRGSVSFVNLSPGIYNIFVYPENPSQGAAVFGIPIAEDLPSAYADSTPFAALRAITGTVMFQGQPDSTAQVYIVGSPFSSGTDAQGRFSFKDIPVCIYTVVARPRVKSPGSVSDSAVVDLTRNVGSTATLSLELK